MSIIGRLRQLPAFEQNHLANFTLAALASTAWTAAALAAEFPAVIDHSAIDSSIGLRIDGAAAGDFTGFPVSTAGDFNGDGFSDIITGAFTADPNGLADAGSVFVVFGKGSGLASPLDAGTLNGGNGFRINGVAAGDKAGFQAGSAGDVNGDGIDDILIGAQRADPNGIVDAGSAYVVFGRKAGFGSIIELSSLNGTNGFRLDGVASLDRAGGISAGAGDINGDGFDDLIIGARFASPNGVTGAGSNYVVFGKASGFAAATSLATLDGNTGFRLDGAGMYDYAGYSVAAAGDFNGDGFDDLLVGAGTASPLGTSYPFSGSTYVVFGKDSGFSPVINLSTIEGSNGIRLDGAVSDDRAGWSSAGAGDVNGDGLDDVIIGAWGADPNTQERAGSTYVVFGKSTGITSPVSLSTLDGSNGFRLDGVAAGDYAGVSVAGAGDINGDGYGDIMTGASLADPDGLNYAGSSYVVFGKATGFTAAISLSALDGSNGFRLDGSLVREGSGRSVGGNGDVNGDGFADLTDSGYGAAPGGRVDAGSAYMVYGRAPDAAVTRVGSAANQYISGGAFNDTLHGGGGNDRLEGRSGADKLGGGSGIDAASYVHAPAGLTANLASPAANTGDAAGDSYASLENLIGSRFADTLTGNSLANAIFGGKGNDALAGGGGDDRLNGGPGKDVLTGGPGADIFALSTTADSKVGGNRDRIADFNAGTSSTSVDRIDLQAIDANTAVLGNQAFTFRGSAAFSGKPGQLRISLQGATVIVSGDLDGDKAPDFEIGLSNFSSLANFNSGDFVR